MIVPHIDLTEAGAPVVGDVPQVSDRARQPPAVGVVLISLSVGKRGAMTGIILVPHRVEPRIRIAMIVQRIARRRHHRIRREELAQWHFLPLPDTAGNLHSFFLVVLLGSPEPACDDRGKVMLPVHSTTIMTTGFVLLFHAAVYVAGIASDAAVCTCRQVL